MLSNVPTERSLAEHGIDPFNDNEVTVLNHALLTKHSLGLVMFQPSVSYFHVKRITTYSCKPEYSIDPFNDSEVTAVNHALLIKHSSTA